MAASTCRHRAEHKDAWRVTIRDDDDQSEVFCVLCPAIWRAKGLYVTKLPDYVPAEGFFLKARHEMNGGDSV